MVLKSLTFKSFIRTYGYWIFIVIMFPILVYLDGVEDIEPVFSIIAFIYWLLVVYWSLQWVFRQIRSTLKQKQEKNNIELLHLQSQVNPHFFFNTLNNLYGLVDQDSKKAQTMILKLSDMMRYSIYDGQQNLVSILDEVAYLENYIELHKMRYHKKIDIEFNLNIQEKNTEVMPLLFILLLENAFKHGVENLNANAFVRIDLISTVDEINFSIVNNYDQSQVPKKPGIGLKNLKRRLKLAYPKKHTLQLEKTSDTYKAQLTLKTK